MELILLIVFGLVAAVALVGFNMQPRNTHFVDKDADGEPDEPDGPAKDL